MSFFPQLKFNLAQSFERQWRSRQGWTSAPRRSLAAKKGTKKERNVFGERKLNLINSVSGGEQWCLTCALVCILLHTADILFKQLLTQFLSPASPSLFLSRQRRRAPRKQLVRSQF
jgi:hypothetical protein